VPRVRAIVFDFNGTLSADEPILCEIFRALFAEHGRPLSAQEYFDQLVGLSDEEIVRRWLGRDDPGVVRERVARYRAAVANGATVSEPVRKAVRHAAERLPVAIVSGAARVEIDDVLRGAGLAPIVHAIVSSDDVSRGKPDPEGYLRVLDLLAPAAGLSGSEPLSRPHAGDVLVLEDTEAGVAAAKAVGMRVVAVGGTVAPERLAAADELVERIDVALIRRLLGN
jgi:beta-phosphoglucomutase-like phosphatase (HAD superfamily)